ncbi:MAG: flagellar basal body-associated FliL family protein [Verrucomicrobiota bacterium]
MADDNASAQKAPEGEGAATKAPKPPFIPILAGAIGGAVVSFLVTQFVLVPKIQKAAFAATASVVDGGAGHGEAPDAQAGAHGGEPKKEESHGGGHGGKDEKDTGPKATYTKEGWAYAFPTVTSNLAGSLGRQYLKCSFQIVSDDKAIASIVEENKAKLKDVVLSVLGTRSLTDVETPASKNVLRAELVANMNKALNSSAIKQIQFTDFLIQ